MRFQNAQDMTWKSAIPILIGANFFLFGIAGVWMSMTWPMAVALSSLVAGVLLFWIGKKNL
jgi:hypothetical protein